MKTRRFLLLLLALLPGFTGCIYDFDPQIEGQEGTLVIEGDILCGDTTLVQVSRLQTLSGEGAAQFLSAPAARVFVESEDGARYEGAVPAEPELDSPCFRIDTRTLDASLRCRLVVEVVNPDYPASGKPRTTYVSDWQEVLQSESVLDSLTFAVSPERDLLEILVHTHGAQQGYYRWVGREIWEYTSEYHALCYYDAALNQILPYETGENYYYCWKRGFFRDILVASTELAGVDRFTGYTVYSTRDRTDRRFRRVYSLVLYQERISREAFSYWTSMRNNSSDVGGLFSPQPSDLHGNIHNPDDPSETVIGYISATTVTKAQRYYRDVTGHFARYNEPATVRPIVRLSQWPKYYADGYVPLWVYIPDVEELPPDYELSYEWAPLRCADCRLQGGSKRVPSGWPNNYQ